uniref:SHSP domain-containing protein n=1 Tax=Syphacia muris TaxID=451379 RepID=A0A0N5AXC4_9BILA
MWRQISTKGTPCIRALMGRQAFHPRIARTYFMKPWCPSTANPFRFLEDQMRDVERHFDKMFGCHHHGWHGALSNFRDFDGLFNPIIEEDGEKKFVLEFDVRRFKPEEICVTTSEKNSTLKIEAKHKGENENLEFSREIMLPKGVVAKELKCRFTSDGLLQLKAPYNPPKETEAPKDTEIKVKHE